MITQTQTDRHTHIDTHTHSLSHTHTHTYTQTHTLSLPTRVTGTILTPDLRAIVNAPPLNSRNFPSSDRVPSGKMKTFRFIPIGVCLCQCTRTHTHEHAHKYTHTHTHTPRVLMAILSDSSWLFLDAREINICSADFI